MDGAEKKRTRRSQRDYGMGFKLAVVRQVVTRRGGQVSVQSSPGAGSRFTVTLPSAGARLGVVHAHG